MGVLYLVLFATVIASGSIVFVIKPGNKKIVNSLLAFSGAFLIGICFMKIVPEVYSSPVKYMGLFVMLGFLIQLLLEFITEGAEHGHKHDHHEGERTSPFVLLAGLCIHGFIEGTPISSGLETRLTHTLVTGIVIHNIPISITLMSLFLHYGCSKRKAMLYLVVFALMTPLGSFLGGLIPFDSTESMQTFFTYVLAVVIGIFLHVSTSILFETGEQHKYNLQKLIVVCLGILTSFGLCFI